ncbi:hypothetical protein ACROYT_G016313 [Oculina patagonica]
MRAFDSKRSIYKRNDLRKWRAVATHQTSVKLCQQKSCLSYLKDYFKSYYKPLGYVFFGDIEGQKIALIKCEKGSSGPGGSIVVVKNAVGVLRPKAVFCLGFCGGLNYAKVKLGDVVVSARLITYAPTKVTEDDIQERGLNVPLKKDLANLIKHAGEGWDPPLTDPEALDVTVHRDGVFLSGPEVIDNKDRRDDLTKRFPQAIAIEMEGEGLVTAAHDLDIEWIVIKGVSDFADGKKSDTESWRPFASLMAASVVADMLSDPIVFKDWSHYQGEPAILPPAAPEPRRELRSSSTHSPVATALAVKDGCPSEDELEELSTKLGDKWENLGRRLGFAQATLDAFHKENERLFDKAYRMLLSWKEREGSDATYQVLCDALCHRLVNLKILAEKFCCHCLTPRTMHVLLE